MVRCVEFALDVRNTVVDVRCEFRPSLRSNAVRGNRRLPRTQCIELGRSSDRIASALPLKAMI
ncbi:hypothetical protein [Roseimaritima sediminicola]|uniref:hypothetical protein n=1 Tax=Roseimaritima sediminicola TaxID=2662066 RepID=UPI0012983B0D|nr:hypothetical protein [Roseimaritima sediminicola]